VSRDRTAIVLEHHLPAPWGWAVPAYSAAQRPLPWPVVWYWIWSMRHKLSFGAKHQCLVGGVYGLDTVAARCLCRLAS